MPGVDLQAQLPAQGGGLHQLLQFAGGVTCFKGLTVTAGVQLHNGRPALLAGPHLIGIRIDKQADRDPIILQGLDAVPERFQMDQLQLTAQGVSYKGQEAGHLVFCEGFQVVQNPYFKWLPVKPTKGEVLEVQTENFNPECIYNKAVYVVPVGAGRLLVGATYDWRQPDEQPSAEGRQELAARFRPTVAGD